MHKYRRLLSRRLAGINLNAIPDGESDLFSPVKVRARIENLRIAAKVASDARFGYAALAGFSSASHPN